MAFASTWRQNETRGFRGLAALLVVLLLAFVMLATAAMFLWPEAPTGAQYFPIPIGKETDFEVGKPVLIQNEKLPLLHVVRQPDGDIYAFIAKDTYLGCTVPWRPTFNFNGRQGWFRDPCHASTYDLDGTCVYGPCYRNLDRVPVEVHRGRVYVDGNPREVIRGAPVTNRFQLWQAVPPPLSVS